MVLKYRGHPPFRKTILSESMVSLEPYSERAPTRQDVLFSGKITFLMDMNDEEVVRRIMDYSGITDWSLVSWEDEGLPQPIASGCKYVLKIGVEPGQTIYVRVPLLAVHGYNVKVYTNIYLKSSFTMNFYFVLGGQLSNTRMKFPKNFEGTDNWVRCMNTWFAEQHNGMTEFVVQVSNNGTAKDCVYISIIIAALIKMDEVYEVNNDIYLVDNVKVPLSNETVTFTIGAHYAMVFKCLHAMWFVTKVVSDGTNALTAKINILGADRWSASTTSATETALNTLLYVRRDKSLEWVSMSWSTAGTGEIHAIVIWAHALSELKGTSKRLSGSYTSDGNGVTDTVTILDYSASTSHIRRIIRVYASGDANTTQLQLQVDGEVMWDFLNDGNTCTIEIGRCVKVELLVNDNGSATTTSTTTVNYVVQYEEEPSILVY